jgi:hypothetical protein
MTAEKGWIGDPQPPKEWHAPHLHSPCPVCGQPTRYKQFGPMRCACNRYRTKEAREAHRRYAEEGTWRATQHPPSSVQ